MCTGRGAPPISNRPPSAAHYGALWTLLTLLTPGVCTQDREIRTETSAGRRRSRGEMTQPKLATLLHVSILSNSQCVSHFAARRHNLRIHTRLKIYLKANWEP